MSFVFSKNKEKRTRSSTGESNSSFVKNVTSRVSGLLPAGITKWFSSPSSSSANGSAAVVDGTDSSTEDEASESPSIAQPPAKRIRYSSPLGKYSNLTTSETTTTSNVITETGSVLYNSIQSPLGRHSFRRDPNFVSTPIRAHTDEMSMNSMMERSDRNNPFMQHTVSAIGQSIALKRKSLFDSQKQKEQSLIACAKTAAHQVKDLKQPHFKPHLLGSPFYPGGTMYGGASASTTYVNHPHIKQRKMTYVNESKDHDTVNMSTSSRRVMDLLENYSSPLIEAKRIPRYELSELCDINRSIQPSTSSRNSYKTQELYVPTTANLVRMKARSRLMDSTKAARQIIASHSSTLSYKPYTTTTKRDQPEGESGPAKSQFKLNTRLTRSNQGDAHLTMPEAVELPTGVLQIDQNNLPKFSFAGSVVSPIEKSANKPSGEGFNFSTPFAVATEVRSTGTKAPSFNFGSPEKLQVNASPPKFSFGVQTPTEIPKTNSQPEKEEPPKMQNTQTSILAFAKKSDDWKCSECWVSNKIDAKQCACCGAKPPAKQIATTGDTTPKCTTCKLSNSQPNSDKCVNCEKMRANMKPMNSLPVTKTVNSSKWKCGDCWVENKESAENCVCCGSRNSQKSASVPAAPAPFAADKDWRCEDCLITNKPSIEKCAACGGAKPGTKPVPKKLPSITSSDLFKNANKMIDIVETQKARWECSVCLVSNTTDKEVCPCCGAAKQQPDNVPSKFTNFKFNSDSNSGFKFGIDPKVQETKLAEKSDAPKPKITEESETNNNVVPSYTFTLPSKKPEKVDSKPNEEPKPSFAFGIPKQSPKASEDPKPSFSFGIQKENSKPAEEPKPAFSFGVSKQGAKTSEEPKPAYSFGVPKEDSKPAEEPKTFSFGVPKATSKTSEEPKPSFTFDTTKQGSKTAEEPKPAFSFGFAKQNTTSVATSLDPISTTVTKTPDLLKRTEDKEKPQEVPSISLKPPEANPFSSSLFSSSASTSNPQNAMNAFINNSVDAKKTASPSEPLAQQNAVTEAPKLQFPSTGAGNTSTNSLFTSPASTNSLITQAAPATSIMGGLFSKSEATVSSAIATPSTTPFQNNVQSTPAAPAASTPFSFGSNQRANPAEKISFRFGSTTSTPTFGATPQANASPFGLPVSNPLTNGPSNPLGGNGISTNPLAQSITGNPLGNVGGTGLAPTGNGILGSGTSSVFNAPAQDNSRPWNVNVNQFGATPAPSPFGAPATNQAREGFTFGATPAPTQFGAATSNVQTPTQFGAATSNVQAPAQFGSATSNQTPAQFGAASSNVQPHVFGASAPGSQFMYGMGQSAASRPAPLFGSSHPPPSPMNAMPAAMSTFEAPAPAPPSSFNFGVPQGPTGVFGFGQQPQQPAMGGMQQPNMYNFGGGASPSPVQFNMGSAPSSAAARRPVRKAVRRTQQR